MISYPIVPGFLYNVRVGKVTQVIAAENAPAAIVKLMEVVYGI